MTFKSHINLGEKYGLLKVASCTSEHRGSKKLWLCDCDCGGTKKTTAEYLTTIKTPHCGCLKSDKSLPGKRFGLLTVVGLSDKTDKYGRKLFLCKCDCGGEKLAIATSLKRERIKSCGCLLQSKVSVGDRYGKLKVLERSGKKDTYPTFLCECDCGNQKVYPSNWLLLGQAKSCGCSQNSIPVDLRDKRFGYLVALTPTDKRGKYGDVIWECVCDCGRKVYRTHANLKKGIKSANCGCMQSELKKEKILKVQQEVLLYTENTSIKKLESKTLYANNKSGVKGVYYLAKKTSGGL